jgi:hypothetical protein
VPGVYYLIGSFDFYSQAPGILPGACCDSNFHIT